MTRRDTPLLHRDDPARAALTGHVKVTREDWLNHARDALVTGGAGEVKILGLARQMGVSRSSFYGYFRDRSDLLDALLTEWEARNSAQIIAHCRLPAASITEGCCNFFRCFVDDAKFDRGLDFAVREWARRDRGLRLRVDAADTARLAAVEAMFLAHGYAPADADARARILYFMQLGYHALEVFEPMPLRLSRVGSYIMGFTGMPPEPFALSAFIAEVEAMGAP
ncbi:TetR/AcrR family transcriptional regulator [Sulfitobacter albidus]|uniref:TetR/AcrR family transcriptional regulator n=1 Tax=Sulfitobacter albidus TaxID=2829501 RepID=A0A975JGR1_9RHOB|nr:TetR/AcrR family transcriptional regulator [Sulfitobacter albidus]QUJ78209.1 TetR/AcrR family transcriptional regulator [Sulfitobacter albidus]